MAVETLIADVESALLRWIRWGLLWRLPPAADLAALAARPVAVLRQWALVFVTAEGVLYEWDQDSQAAPVLPDVVKPSVLGPTDRGRWVRMTTGLTYGAGGVSLSTKQTGYLRAVESWESDEGADVALERADGDYPVVMVQFVGDDLTDRDNTPGKLYDDVLRFKLLVLTQNLRGEPNATLGPRSAFDALDDPGAYRIIGDLRRLLAGLAFATDVEAVERLKLGGAELAVEDLDRRVFVWSMDLSVKAWFEITDEDLVDAAIRVQPDLTDNPPPRFDKLNCIVRGGGLDEGKGPGLGRVIDATLGLVGGVAVSAASQAVTFAASSDVYRDLDAAGVWHFVTVPAETQPPAVAAGLLRVARTRTDGAGVVDDKALCSFSVPYGLPFDIS